MENRVTEEQRERARQRYSHRCGYCGVHEDDAGASLTIDHHRPSYHGGDDDDDNLVYCFPRCNEHKSHYWHEVDPPHIRLLHPLRDDLVTHLHAEEDGQLIGLTPEGVFFMQRLRLNRPQLVTYRLNQQEKQNLRAELDADRQRIHELEQRIAKLNAALELTEVQIEREGA